MALSSYASYIGGYLPEKVKDAAGLSHKISEDVQHITWLSIERVFWPQDAVRLFLVLGYSNGFQVWDVQDPSNSREILSKPDKPVVLVRMLPMPLACSAEDNASLGVASAPMLAYLHRGAPALVRLFSMRAHDDVHLLRLTEPAKTLQASRRFLAVGLQRQVELYDAFSFQAIFSVQCAGASPIFALGHRWLAYNLPPQQSASALSGLSGTSAARLPSMVREGSQYIGQVIQRTLDNMLMAPPDGELLSSAPATIHTGIVTIRDTSSKAIIAQFNDHSEPIEMMVWDPSGLQLVTCAALGHHVLVHRALVGTEHALMMQDSEQGDFALGGVVFKHLYTLSRGYTPASISDITLSDDGQEVAVSSAKGTTHVFRLPPLHSAATRHQLNETGAVRLAPTAVPRASASGHAPGAAGFSIISSGGAPPKPLQLNASTRIKLGSIVLQEGLMPSCGFINTASRQSSSTSRVLSQRICVATRAGTLGLYALNPSAFGEGSSAGVDASASAGEVGVSGTRSDTGEWQAELLKESSICRSLQHFRERQLSPRSLEAHPKPRASPRLGPMASPRLGPLASPRPGALPSPRTGAVVGHGLDATALVSPRACSDDGASSDAAKWLSQVETATHVPMDVPIWHCPQLSFHTFPSSTSSSDLNASLRSGQPIPGCKPVHISRQEGPGDQVHYSGVNALSELLVGALGTAVDDEVKQHVAARPAMQVRHRPATSRGSPSMVIPPAWGNVGDQQGEFLEPLGAVGAGLEDVDEDWVKA